MRRTRARLITRTARVAIRRETFFTFVRNCWRTHAVHVVLLTLCVVLSGPRLPRRWHLRLEHLECDHVDEHDPDGRVEQLGLVLDERDRRHALALETLPVGPGSLQLAAYVLLELLHVEQLERALQLEGAIRQLEDVVGDGAAVVQRVLDEYGALAEPLDEDVARLVHLDFATLADLKLELLRLRIAKRVLEPVDSDSEKYFLA